MARLLRSVPELLTLIKGMHAATRAVSSTLVLLVLLIYVFGIVFMSLVGKNENIADLFGDLRSCMWTLLMTGTLVDNVTSVLNRLGAQDKVAAAVFLLFILLSALTVMNMLIGVLCEVVSAV